MVKLGTQDLNNISVIRSGKMVLSFATMPEYFTKDTENDIVIDPSRDLTIFANTIAKILKITKRFAGTEPFCNITNQYNSGMKEFLPRSNIEFVEIPRIGDISASKVRKYILAEEYDKLIDIVPKTTFGYLVQSGHIKGDNASVYTSQLDDRSILARIKMFCGRFGHKQAPPPR